MKTVKKILATLLLIALLPTSIGIFGQIGSHNTLKNEIETAASGTFTAAELLGLEDTMDRLDNTTSSLSFLLVCAFICILSAGITALSQRDKHYGAFVSGILVLIPFIWNSSLQKNIQSFATSESALRYFESVADYENTSGMGLANLLLFLPMAALLLIGTIEMIVHFAKKDKNVPAEHKTPSNQTVATAPATTSKENHIDDLKKYKELLDNGVITQDEFDAKKKQLLGL